MLWKAPSSPSFLLCHLGQWSPSCHPASQDTEETGARACAGVGDACHPCLCSRLFPRWADTLPSPSEDRAEGWLGDIGKHAPISRHVWVRRGPSLSSPWFPQACAPPSTSSAHQSPWSPRDTRPHAGRGTGLASQCLSE